MEINVHLKGILVLTEATESAILKNVEKRQLKKIGKATTLLSIYKLL